MTLRPAKQRDLPTCMEMFDELNRLQSPWRVFPPRPGIREEVENRYRAALQDPDALLVVAEEDGAVVGMAEGHLHRPSTFSDQVAVELSSVFVSPGYRHRGLARSLTAEVARFARRRGAAILTLKSFAQNEEATEAWGRIGFRPRVLQMVATSEELAAEPEPGEHQSPPTRESSPGASRS